MLAVAILAALSGTASAVPSAQLIEQAQRALSECVLEAPETVLSAKHLADLTDLQLRALHWLIQDEYASSLELATIKHLRLASDVSLAAAYHVNCEFSSGRRQREAFRRMTPTDPVVIGDIAFVPWLDRRGDYTGVGLVFVREREQWRWHNSELSAFARRLDAFDVAALDTYVRAEDEDAYLSDCIGAMPAPPEPIHDFDVDRDDKDFDEANALGAAKRKAAWLAARGAFGVPSATAKAILAEILIRSLEFEDAPDRVDPRWRARIERAERLIAEARITNVDWSRFDGLLEWLARAHELGLGGLSVDPGLAKSLRSLVAEPGYVSDALTPAEFWEDGLPWVDRYEPPSEPMRCGGIQMR